MSFSETNERVDVADHSEKPSSDDGNESDAHSLLIATKPPTLLEDPISITKIADSESGYYGYTFGDKTLIKQFVPGICGRKIHLSALFLQLCGAIWDRYFMTVGCNSRLVIT